MHTLSAPYRHLAPLPPRRRRGLRRLLAAVLTIVMVLVVLVAISLVGALRTPGNQSFKAKWADWLRAHHAALVANAVEQYYYSHNAPPKGGRPAALNSVPPPSGRQSTAPTAPTAPIASTVPTGRTASTAPSAPTAGLPRPVPIPLVVNPGLPGEGQWTPTGAVVHGIPAMYVAQFRADTVYTGQITSAVWIDPTLLRVALVPGAQDRLGT